MAERLFRLSQWDESVSPAAGWVIGCGRFLGGTVDDVLGYFPGNGTLWVGANQGGRFAFTRSWATVSPAGGWQFAIGDFTGDGLEGVAGYNPANGTVWVGHNTGSRFSFERWATLDPAAGWRISTGFFKAGAKADLLAHHADTGTLWVGRNTGSGFDFSAGAWATLPPGSWEVTAGDFIGNGRADAVAYNLDDGSIWVGENHGSSFELSQWGSVSPAGGWHIDSGYFTGRDKADLLAFHAPTGGIWVGENQVNHLAFTEAWATVNSSDAWQFATGSVTGDRWDDVVGYSPGNGSLWVGESSLRPIEGYCWPLSAAPGEVISFHMSGEGASVAEFQRHVSISAAVDGFPAGSQSFTATRQPVPPDPGRTGCAWTQTFALTVPDDWTPGIYSATCTDSAGSSCQITFVVKPAPGDRSRIAVLANANTWLAYNGWGGQSKYSGLARTSFLRPMPAAGPNGDAHLTRGELWILGWLESEGFRPDVYTDIDFHNDGCDPAQYPCLIFGTHPEYWTEQMYDNLAAYLDAGGSAVYLGGNGVFEIGEYDATRTHMIFRNGIEGGPREDALFRTRGRPERSLLGVATERCSVPGSPLEVLDADHPLFAGTGAVNGLVFGDSGFNTGWGNGKASAWEVDTASGPGSIGISTDCLLDDRAVPMSALPDGLVIIATGQSDGIGPGADVTYYDHPGGGFMFTIGSITVGGSLVIDPVLSGLMTNVLVRAGV
ncbi:N,N-dimethylformamidase beta subunit family domain-containing protein [Naasia sp. SYSU D00948]|uniref:N,N-dimethylformamidase beta subunit family domain-containing protein n=1 Tax=Naasia sp. SYSU D00948 TaxID=2817379 RepID=UPI001B313360|nr:N,N-dimethylformamidase beta subunit family domain-containing protein [Naasia sp. SYSU D00948]